MNQGVGTILALLLAVATWGCSSLSVYQYESKVTTERARGEAPPPRLPATASLLQQAEAAAAAGEYEQAAALLERALRVDSGDPVLWSQLAEVRLRQEDWAQAEELAKRSNQLAAQDAGLQRRNWQIIAHSRRMRGDEVGARSAAEKAGG